MLDPIARAGPLFWGCWDGAGGAPAPAGGASAAPATPAAPAQPSSPPSDGGGFFGGGMLPLVLVGLIFYFLLIRPQGRERKKREAMLKSIKKHDKVITNAGIHGTVLSVDDTSVLLRIDDNANVRVRFERSALWQVKQRAEGSEAAEGATKTDAASGGA